MAKRKKPTPRESRKPPLMVEDYYKRLLEHDHEAVSRFYPHNGLPDSPLPRGKAHSPTTPALERKHVPETVEPPSGRDASRIAYGEQPSQRGLSAVTPSKAPVKVLLTSSPPQGAGTSSIFTGTQPPQPDPAFVTMPTIVQRQLTVREGENLSVTEAVSGLIHAKAYERIGSPPHKELALIQLRALIEACDEAVHFDRARNVRPPYLWIDDKQYLVELRDILLELQRLNAFLEALTNNEPSVLKGADKVASRFGRFFDTYSGEMGKGAAQLTKGAIVLGLVYAGVGDGVLAKLLGK